MSRWYGRNPRILETPVDPFSDRDKERLQAQRRQCGWYEDRVEDWFMQLRQEDPGFGLWWIRLAEDEDPIGHIGFYWRHEDPDVASPQLKRCCGALLWIKPAHRSGGVARVAWASNTLRGLELGYHTITGTTFADSWAMDKEFYAKRGAKWGIHHNMPMEKYYLGLPGCKLTKRANTFRYTWPNGVTEDLEVVYFEAPLVDADAERARL